MPTLIPIPGTSFKEPRGVRTYLTETTFNSSLRDSLAQSLARRLLSAIAIADAAGAIAGAGAGAAPPLKSTFKQVGKSGPSLATHKTMNARTHTMS